MADKPKRVRKPRQRTEREKLGMHKPTQKEKVGAKLRFIVTPEMIEEVKILSGRGLTQEQIYRYYGWSKNTWYDKTKEHPLLYEAIFSGKSKTISFVAGKLMELVKKGNLGAIIFYLKTQGRFSEHILPESPPGEKDVSTLVSATLDPVEASKIYQQVMLRE